MRYIYILYKVGILLHPMLGICGYDSVMLPYNEHPAGTEQIKQSVPSNLMAFRFQEYLKFAYSAAGHISTDISDLIKQSGHVNLFPVVLALLFPITLAGEAEQSAQL